MKIITTVKEMQAAARRARAAGRTVGLVPTMGALHGGHASLIRRSRAENRFVVVSVFVNPTQFGPGEDYLKYPRPFRKDAALCLKEKVDAIFRPAVKELYPEACPAYIDVEKLSAPLCGRFRPGHFRGVATVVAKLFNACLPDRAYFGEKDYQQLKVVESMASGLNFPVEIVPCATVRERDGLAKSSRNSYLEPREREDAALLSWALFEAKRLIGCGRIRTGRQARELVRRRVRQIPGSKIDYVAVCDPRTLGEIPGRLKRPARILAAVRVGVTRLIDNIEV